MPEGYPKEAEINDAKEALLFREKGYSVFPDVLKKYVLEELRGTTSALISRQSSEQLERFPYQGSMIPVDYKDPVFADLISNECSVNALRTLGYDRPKWMSGYIINKPPHAPPLWWHQDWWAWDEPCSMQEPPPQAFLMYYLCDTTPENGCLRVIPGSHRTHIDLHDKLPPPHTKEINSMGADSPVFQKHPQEIDVPVHAGDVIIGDVRLLHAAHANNSDQNRTCITLWYLPDFEHLPSNIQSYIIGHHCLPSVGWWHQQKPDVPQVLRNFLPVFEGEKQGVAFNRDPRQALQHLLSLPQSGNR